MNKVTNQIVTKDNVSRGLLDAMMVSANLACKSLEEAAEDLHEVYKNHMFIKGTFCVEENLYGPVLVFSGTICGESIKHSLWC